MARKKTITYARYRARLRSDPEFREREQAKHQAHYLIVHADEIVVRAQRKREREFEREREHEARRLARLEAKRQRELARTPELLAAQREANLLYARHYKERIKQDPIRSEHERQRKAEYNRVNHDLIHFRRHSHAQKQVSRQRRRRNYAARHTVIQVLRERGLLKTPRQSRSRYEMLMTYVGAVVEYQLRELKRYKEQREREQIEAWTSLRCPGYRQAKTQKHYSEEERARREYQRRYRQENGARLNKRRYEQSKSNPAQRERQRAYSKRWYNQRKDDPVWQQYRREYAKQRNARIKADPVLCAEELRKRKQFYEKQKHDPVYQEQWRQYRENHKEENRKRNKQRREMIKADPVLHELQRQKAHQTWIKNRDVKIAKDRARRAANHQRPNRSHKRENQERAMIEAMRQRGWLSKTSLSFVPAPDDDEKRSE